MNEMNKVKLIVNRQELTARFEMEGDIWKWLNSGKSSNKKHRVFSYMRGNHVAQFGYEMYLDKYIRQYSDIASVVVEI